MRRTFCAVGGVCFLLALVTVLPGIVDRAEAAELSPDQAATLVLDSARRAYNEGNFPAAADRFREFLRAYGGHRDAPAAHYGLALALLAQPQPDYTAAIESLKQVVARGDFPDRPQALNDLGAAVRALGYESAAQAQAKPNEARGHLDAAAQRFQEAERHFAAAAEALAARLKSLPADAPQRRADQAWADRARCDRVEMLLRLGKFKEAAQQAEEFLADAATADSPCRDLATYHLGYARFALGETLEAGRALSRLAPFAQEFGGHARYLLARTHHLAGERPEAAALYQAVLADYADRKKAAQAALANPQALKPPQRAAMEALVNRPPDYLGRSAFYAALVLAEQGKFAEALNGFTAMMQQYPKSPLVAEAQLRRGYCQMQAGNLPQAVADFQPLREHPQLADRALWWTARSQVAAADPKNDAAYKQALGGAVQGLRQAADRAAALAPKDPDAKVRRGDILMELADTQQLAGQFNEAAATYQQVFNEKNNPDRAEEALQRQVTALHLGGRYKESDDLARRFEQTFPKSTLLPAVLFRCAENAYLTATAAANDPNAAARREEIQRLFEESVKRYEAVIRQFPEFPHVNLARQGMATAHYRLGRYGPAIEALAAIPESERTGDLGAVPYLLADCLLRTLPPEADDAIQAAGLLDQAEQAVKLLEGYIAAQGQNAQPGDALLKLGHAYRRIGAVLADRTERQKMLSLSRGVLERAIPALAKDLAAQAAAVFERARCLLLLGDTGGAMGELNRFQQDPFRAAPVAPMALARLSALMRAAGKAADAANLIGQARAQHEPALAKDPDRADWIPALRYEHAVALQESGKRAEAKAMFDALLKESAGRPEAINALWRGAQCRREELTEALASSRQAADKPGASAEELAAARRAMQEALDGLRQAAEPLKAQAEDLGKTAAGSPAHQHLLYETAWCFRAMADAQIEAARRALAQEALEQARAKLAKSLPPGQDLPPLAPPEIPLARIPPQPSEQAARFHYGRLLVAAPDSLLAVQARLELAEMDAARGQSDSALELLADALSGAIPPDLAVRIRLRLAASFLAKGDPAKALAQVEAVGKDAGGPRVAEARYLAGEAWIQQKDWGKAIEQLTPFRDQDPFRNVPGVSDRALLRLGYAYAQAGQWDPSRQALEALCQRFPRSPWVEEAWYGVGWAWQKQNQPDNAVNAYTQVTRRTVAEVAARAQLQIGLCRLEQKRYEEAAKLLLVVPLTYDYPELNAPAWCEAARALLAMKQTAEAADLLKRAAADQAAGPWADIARQRLAEIQ